MDCRCTATDCGGYKCFSARHRHNENTSQAEMGLVATTFASIVLSPVVRAGYDQHWSRVTSDLGATGFINQRAKADQCTRSLLSAISLCDDTRSYRHGTGLPDRVIASNEAFGQVYPYRLCCVKPSSRQFRFIRDSVSSAGHCSRNARGTGFHAKCQGLFIWRSAPALRRSIRSARCCCAAPYGQAFWLRAEAPFSQLPSDVLSSLAWTRH